MESTIIYQTIKGNSYYLDFNNSIAGFLHPALYEYIQGISFNSQAQDLSEVDYYKKKYDYLVQHGLFEKQIKEKVEVCYTPEMIEESLANTEQVVFEVTDKCNLRCAYCGYRDLYTGYDKRENKDLSVSDAVRVWDRIHEVIASKVSVRTNEKLVIGFYGGEPLLNFDFISKIVSHIKKTAVVNVQFNMTTNAILLDKYMDFLIANNFSLLISLDGDYNGNAYRLTANDANSHPQIIKNVDLLRERAPNYFDKQVQFNAVLHNANTIYSTYKYIHERYGKKPHVSEMNSDGVSNEKGYEEMKKGFIEDFMSSQQKEVILEEYFSDFPLSKDIPLLMRVFSSCSISSIADFLSEKTKSLPTGTCIPFSKKVFVTVNSKLLVCEKIDHFFALGQLNETDRIFDFKFIANRYNSYYESIEKLCNSCYYARICGKCIFSNAEEVKGSSYKCSNYMDLKSFNRYMAYLIHFLEEHPIKLDTYIY